MPILDRFRARFDLQAKEAHMFPLVDMMQCQNLSVSVDVMHHVVQVESAANPYAIGVVGGRLVRQPRSLAEAVSTAEMLERGGYNFSVGLAQVNRYNLSKYGVSSYTQAFDGCTSLRAGSRILAECHARAKGDWGSAFSCYYSGNFTTGYQHGYVQKVFASIAGQQSRDSLGGAIALAGPVNPGRALAVSPTSAAASRRMSTGNESGELSVSVSSVASQRQDVQSATDSRRPASSAHQITSVGSPADTKSSMEGAVRLTRSGPVFPASSNAANPSESSLSSTPTASSQVAEAAGPVSSAEPDDNAFVF